jgi:hypothetical protein
MINSGILRTLGGTVNTRKAPVWTFWVAVAVIFAVGIALRFFVPSHWAPGPGLNEHKSVGIIGILTGLGEALIIAAIVAAVVDPYAKFRLGKEVGREIAKETAGQHLPLELRQALESIQEINLYLLRMAVDVELEKVDSHPGLLKWRMTMHYEVENASWNKRSFEHRVSISDSRAESADGKVIEVAHYLNGACQYRLREPDQELNRMCKKEEGTTFFTHEAPRKISSSRQGAAEKCEYFNSTERLVADSEVQVIQVSLPTVGVVVTVRHPQGVSINTSLEYVDGSVPECPDGEKKGRVWRWKSSRAYLTNEHIWLMYELDKPTPDPVSGPDSTSVSDEVRNPPSTAELTLRV